MALEIEIKLKIEHLAPIRDRLKEIGATRIGEALETNIFFDTTDRVLLASDCGLRLRRSHDLHGGGEKLILTYKGPRHEGPVKSREEIEITIDDQQAATDLISRLGYAPVLTFEKRRETWQIDKCNIELDLLPELGCFIEIEGPTETDVLKLREKLRLSHVAGVVKTYADLVAHHLSDRGARETKLTFK